VAGVGLLITLLLMVGCQSRVPTAPDEVPRIKAQELKAWLDAGKDVVVVDTRGPQEFYQGHIPGALLMPFNQGEEQYYELPRTGQIVLY
jgi:rhodanese-related sulfurtransferase